MMEDEVVRVLFVCGRNQWRSPTGERVYRDDGRMEVRSAGLSPSSRRRLGAGDLEWADVVFLMEREQKRRVVEGFREKVGEMPELVVLDIPDDYGFMDEVLIGLLRDGVEGWFI